MDFRRGRGKERVFGGRKVDSISSSSSRTDKKEVLVDNYVNLREGVKGLKLEQSGSTTESEFDERYSQLPRFPIDNWISGNNLDMDMNRSASVDSSVGEISAYLKNFAGSLRSRESMDQWGVEKDQFERFCASPRVVAGWGRIPPSAYHDEGTSSYKLDSFDGHGEQRYRGDLSEVEHLEQDRAELLRKLVEVKEKLSRSYDVADKPREMVPEERSRTPPDRYGDRLNYNLSMQPYDVDKQMPRSPYFNYGHGPVPFMDHRGMDMQHFYPPQRHPLNVIPEYEDPSQPQMNRRAPYRPLQSPRPPPHEYFMGQHMDFNLNPLASYQPESAFHSPSCSCLGCYNQNWGSPADFGNRRVPKAPINLNSYHNVNPVAFVPHDYKPRHANPPQLHTRWGSDLDSDNDGYGNIHPRKAMAVNRNGRIFHPVAGGAPFITCFSCFELLKLPRKLNTRNKNQSKLRCGSCKTVISLEIKNKKLITSVHKESKQLSSKVDQRSNEVLKGSGLSSRCSPNESKQLSTVVDQSSNEMLKGSSLSSHCSPNESKQLSTEVDQSYNEILKGWVLISDPNAGDTNSCCDDLENSGHELESIGNKDNSLQEDQRLNLDESEKSQGLTSSSSVSSKEEKGISDSVISHRDISDSVAKDSFSPAPPGSPLREQSDSPSKHALSTDGKGNKSERMDQDKVLFGRITSRSPGSPLWKQSDSPKHALSTDGNGNKSECMGQDKVLFSRITSQESSLKDRSVESEVDTSYNDYLNTSISQESAEGNKEEYRLKIGKGADSFLVGLIKKSFKDPSKPSQIVKKTRPNVFINGQPISDYVVKKAEKHAGPIQPGDYWYDFRAGFWGVMGQTCLGIIPPFIEEFDYPMPTNCAAGNTGVYVNGRELHQRDLDLLASRGLPTTRDKFYMIEISGTVVDEDSGEELGGLGKLAPTIEKVKHGFGMKVPKMVV